MTDYSTGWHVDSSINVHIVPRLGSRKLNSVTPMVVGRFLDEMESDGVGRGNQVNIFRVLKAILRDAYAKGAMADDPVKGVQEPEYVRGTVAIPSLAYVTKALAVADEDLALEIVMMAGCGLRNGEARAVNVNNVVAQDVYRVREQIHSNTLRPANLKHRRAGEFREAIERYAEKHGTTRDGYLLRGPGGYFTEGMERRRVRKLFADLPPEEGVGMYGFRHYFASNALGSGIPITDVVESMGHKSIEETYRAYRHLMPGSITKAARILDAGLWPRRPFPGVVGETAADDGLVGGLREQKDADAVVLAAGERAGEHDDPLVREAAREAGRRRCRGEPARAARCSQGGPRPGPSGAMHPCRKHRQLGIGPGQRLILRSLEGFLLTLHPIGVA
ncbi:tyrosine-type recombinase/integrase [Streptomyces gardneri]|uniref:tyrosine-type recombinase/integrase n=1 Tax=Streptomyces gardneri TaxID=66892 RepID=UPI0037CFDE6C